MHRVHTQYFERCDVGAVCTSMCAYLLRLNSGNGNAFTVEGTCTYCTIQTQTSIYNAEVNQKKNSIENGKKKENSCKY